MTHPTPPDPEEPRVIRRSDISPLSAQVVDHWSGPLATVDSVSPALSEEIVEVSQRRLRTLRELARAPKFVFGAGLFAIVALLALLAPLIAPYDPNLPDYAHINENST